MNYRLKNQVVYGSLLILSWFTAPAIGLVEAGSCDLLEIIDCDKNQANVKPLEGKWVFGVGVASVNNVPDYVGSDETRQLLLPIPYIFYNGPKFKISQSGIAGKLFNSEKLFVSLSLSGAIPVNSDKNNARKGMDDIDAVFEYGPSFKYFLIGNDSAFNALYLDLNFREARTIKFNSLNFSSSPSLVARRKLDSELFLGSLSISSTLKFEYVSNQYAQTFYGVEPMFATPERQAYQAKGGYAGYRFNTGVRWSRDNHIVNFFLAYSDISSAAYASSPLVKTTHHTLFGGSYIWLFE